MVRQVLDYGPPLTDKTGTGKMRDFCPLVMTRSSGVSSFISVLQCCSIGNNNDMSQVSFFLVWELLKVRKHGRDQFRDKSAPGAKTTPLTSHWTTRFSNASPFTLFTLGHYDPLAFDRLGTHPLEDYLEFV
jgi:hypothetical protein